jgi:hypothetical protein
MGVSKVKLRSLWLKPELVPDAPTRRQQSDSQAFRDRYDFTSSLRAAKSNAYAALGEQKDLPLSSGTNQASHDVHVVITSTEIFRGAASDNSGTGAVGAKAESISKGPIVAPMTAKPAALSSEKPSLTSQSLKELVEKYCFVGGPGKSGEFRICWC